MLRSRAVVFSRATSSFCTHRGAVAVYVALGLTAIIGAAALCIDVGRLVLARQVAQDIADAAAVSAGPLLASASDSLAVAQQSVAANTGKPGIVFTSQYLAESSASDIIWYGPGETVPGYRLLGPASQAMQVKCHAALAYTFGRILGFTDTSLVRRALVVRGPVLGCPIAPMWISNTTPYKYGVQQNLHNTDVGTDANIPGNFGWLQLPSGCTASWSDLIAGVPQPDSVTNSLMTAAGNTVYGLTGERVGQWVQVLNERIARGDGAPWTGETFTNYSPNNPHIILVPMVSFQGGTGSNAAFRIERYGAFWLDNVDNTGKPKSINGRFIQYVIPGADIDPGANDTGLFTYRLVQ